MRAKTCNPKTRRRPTNGFFVPGFENLFNEFMNTSVHNLVDHKNVAHTQPAANVYQTDQDYTLELALPGLSKKDIDIKVDKDVLIISSSKEAEADRNFRLREFQYGTFERRFRLSETIDKENINASFKNGILKLTLSKIEKPSPKSISIK